MQSHFRPYFKRTPHLCFLPFGKRSLGKKSGFSKASVLWKPRDSGVQRPCGSLVQPLAILHTNKALGIWAKKSFECLSPRKSYVRQKNPVWAQPGLWHLRSNELYHINFRVVNIQYATSVSSHPMAMCRDKEMASPSGKWFFLGFPYLLRRFLFEYLRLWLEPRTQVSSGSSWKKCSGTFCAYIGGRSSNNREEWEGRSSQFLSEKPMVWPHLGRARWDSGWGGTLQWCEAQWRSLGHTAAHEFQEDSCRGLALG